MASRVNTKFVILLSLVLGGVCLGVTGVAYYVVTKSASALAANGDAAAAEGDWTQAAYLYSKAVAKDQTNIENLEKWRDALLKKVPETQTEFITDYQMYRGGILRQLATLKRTDLDAYDDYLGEIMKSAIGSQFSRGNWDSLIEVTNSSLRQWCIYDPENRIDIRPGVDPDGEWNRLRRYSGIALTMLFNERLPMNDHEIERARADLEAALAADPDNVLAIRFYALWHFNKALEAEKLNDPEEGARLRHAGIAILDEGLRLRPNHPDLMLRRLAAQIDLTLEEVDVSQAESTGDRNRIYREAMAPLSPMLDDVEAAMISYKGDDTIDANMVATFNRISRIIEPSEGNARADRLVEMLLERDPDDFNALMLKSQYAAEQGNHDESVELLERIVDMPPLTVGLQGYRQYTMKRLANIELINAETVLALANGTPGSPDPEHLGNALQYRERLAGTFNEDHPVLKMADAKIALAKGDINSAQRLLVAYNDDTANADPEGLLMAADIAEQADQSGKALELYERVIEIQPSNMRALNRSARILTRLERYEEASERLHEILDYSPENVEAADILKVVEMRLPNAGIRIDDPILKALVDADAIRMGTTGIPADPESALNILLAAIDANEPDPRLSHMTAQTLLQLGRNDEAMTHIDEGLALFPDDRLLLVLKDRLEASDSLDATLAYIESQDLPEVSKLLSKYAAARRFEEETQADTFLDEAIEIAPTDAAVVEQSFFRALRRDDMAEAERIVGVAEEHDSDRANGLAFRANLLLTQGDVEGAAEALNQAVALGTATARVWRLLGEVRWQVGDGEGAVDAFAEAVSINPNDVDAVTAYVQALARTGKTTEALSVARDNKRFRGRNQRLMEIWLQLEGTVGNPDVAIAQRQFLQRQEPDNRQNLEALASLLVDARRFQEATTLINQLRTEEDSLNMVAVNAKLLADRGDIQGAVNQFMQYQNATPEAERTSTPMVVLGRFLINRGRIDDGIAALQAAQEYPDEGDVNTHIILADALSLVGRFEEAIGVLEASIDEDRDVDAARKRMVVAMLSLGRLDEAEQTLNTIEGEDDLEIVLMRADVAHARGDRPKRLAILDDAVAKFRDSPVPYMRRADAMKTDAQRIPDVLDDLKAALALRPGYAPALQLRAAVYFTQGRDTDGLNDLRAAVNANPLQDNLRTMLLNELLKRGNDAEAQNVARAVVESRPGDRALLVSIGDAFAGFEKWRRAAPYYAGAWSLAPDPRVLERYAEALIQIDEIEAVQSLLQAEGADVENSAALLMIRARMYAAQDNMPDALRDAARSLDMLPVHQTSQDVWYGKIRTMFDSPQPLIAFLSELSQTRPENEWLIFFAARVAAQSPSPEQGLEAMESLADNASEDVRFAALGFLGEQYLVSDQNDKAASAMERALEIRPNHMRLNNNLAFLYAEKLDRPDDALPYALKAVELAPSTVNVLDTLAATYMALDQPADAKRVLNEALRISMNDSDRATVLVRLTRVAIMQRDQIAGLDHLDALKDMMGRNPRIRETYEERYDELMDRLR